MLDIYIQWYSGEVPYLGIREDEKKLYFIKFSTCLYFKNIESKKYYLQKLKGGYRLADNEGKRWTFDFVRVIELKDKKNITNIVLYENELRIKTSNTDINLRLSSNESMIFLKSFDKIFFEGKVEELGNDIVDIPGSFLSFDCEVSKISRL